MMNSMSQELLEAVSIIVAEEEDFQSDGKVKKRLSFMAELNKIRWFQAVADHKLSQYPTTLQQDIALLDSPDFATLSQRGQMTVKVRIEEKKILHSIFETFSKLEQRLLRPESATPKQPKDIHEEL